MSKHVKTSFSFWKSSDQSSDTARRSSSRSPSPGIAQEETHGDALSFSQRSIGFVAPDSQLSTFCPGEFFFQVYVTSS